ncbi:hypothetical protein ACFWOL_16100 [Streptomyces sp. NPDC058442]|uniref:hypothetical protein n=1 Tax=Streptomyces sp. NPDC058442 TaxID=3346503 RepID=UPI0036558980
MHSLQGKVALVTGGASGIGAGVCHRFVDAGPSWVADLISVNRRYKADAGLRVTDV